MEPLGNVCFSLKVFKKIEQYISILIMFIATSLTVLIVILGIL